MLFNQLRIEWAANDQYAYGWFVPLLALGLLWRRWRDHPDGAGDQLQVSGVVAAGFFLLLFALFPLRILEESDVGWRTIWWVHAIILLALSYSLILRAAGKIWANHFAFPIFFLLVSVPWPFLIELPLVQGLMRSVAILTVVVINMLGIPAVRHGNLIEVSTGMVSVDGACSGVRSLQTSLMATLLLGEMFRLRFKVRGILVAVGFSLALVANVARTSVLTWGAATRGMAYMEKSLHDPAGQIEEAFVLVAIYLCALLLARREDKFHNSRVVNQPNAKVIPPATRHVPFSVFRISWLCAGFAWLVFAESSTAYWFYRGDKQAIVNPVWSVNWPVNATGYAERRMTKIEQDVLRCDESRNASWQEEDGNHWSMIALRWNPENKNSFIGHEHTPDQCFTGAGWLLRGEPDPMWLNVNGIDLPMRRYIFNVGGKTVYAFLVFWDERSPGGKQELPLSYGFSRRVKAAWDGKRNQGFKKLEIALQGPTSVEDSLKVLHDGLQKLIQVNGH